MGMNASRRRREGGTGRFRDLHDRHAMYTRGVHVGCTLLRVSRLEVGGRRGFDLMCMRFVGIRGQLGCLDDRQVLGIFLHFLDGIAFGIGLERLVCIAPLLVQSAGRRASSSRVEVKAVGGETGWVWGDGHHPKDLGRSSTGRRDKSVAEGIERPPG